MDEFLYRARPWAITLVDHNWPIIILVALIPLAALNAYLRPTRRALLPLYGMLALAVAFEYQKHGLRVIRSTLNYLFARNPEARVVSQMALVDALPLAMYLFGFALVLLWIAQPQLDRLVARAPGRARPAALDSLAPMDTP